jgi:hypothetical protein
MTVGSLVTDITVREYFKESLQEALRHQHVDAGEDTVFYVVNLLAHYVKAERLFTYSQDGPVLQPLALLYVEATEASTCEERNQALKRLGDVALLVAGMFSASLNRKVVDVDYYIAMGGSAYAYLSEVSRGSLRSRAFGGIFAELSRKFQSFVDALSEVGEKSDLVSSKDIMRLYELWIRTGSRRAADRLRRLGIEPALGSASRTLN